jgi:cell shape-determining protein MreD
MRRALLAAVPVLLLTFMVQVAIVSRMVLLSGNGDIILLVLAAWALQERARGAWVWGALASLMAGLVSGIPWYIYLVAYLTVVFIARLLIHRIWQAPLLAMFTVTLIGTMELLLMTYVRQTLFESPLPFSEVFLQIVLPSVLLNLLMAIPVHALVKDLANRLYPAEVVA